MYKKFVTLFAAGSMVLTLAACGNSSSTKSTKDNEARSAKVVKSSNSTNKKKALSASTKNESKKSTSSSAQTASSSQATASSQSSASQTSSSQNTQSQYKVVKTGDHSSTVTAKSDSTTQAQMTATDAKNIVKEHLLNKINEAGANGQARPDVPSMDEIDGYTATQNGTNDWTVSGNGHTYHVTATSVTEE
ncbi:hypothetical protein [Limosilactobacillus kribbianus]|uniref:hypothetical protein n=1 Tax=Limosilactobacillus kribbianus TaxID=2982695 RepID=UPI002263E6B9|nr:hypothetical protein [Limosilactobacillus kribbianus]